MALPNLRRFDVQARYSLNLSLAALLPLGIAIYACLRNFAFEVREIQYGENSMFLLAFLACIGTAGTLAALGAILGFNSAEQRRNEANKKSWLGFFIGTAVVSLTIIVFAGFYILRLQIPAG